jgi:prolipoprotein diacylglyceryl transferase
VDKAINFPNLGINLGNVGQSFTVFGFEIAYYGIAVVVGMMIGLFIMTREAKRLGEDDDKYWDMGIIMLIAGVIGARIFYVIFAWDNYKDNLLGIFNLRQGGLAIYGGILGAIVAVFIYGKIQKISFPRMLDCIAPGLLIGQIIGRWGNFFNREVFGGYTNNIFAMQLPVSAVREQSEITQQMWDNVVNISGADFIQVHPTFLYEGLWNLGVFILLWFYRKRKKFDGEVFALYLIGYGVGRFWIEAVRTDQLLIAGTNIPVSMVISAAFIVVALGIIIKNMKNSKKSQDCEETKETQDIVE